MQLPHRLNSDGSFDSICPHCFVTIGTAASEDDLERLEGEHVCDPVRLEHFERLKQPPHSEKPPEVESIKKLG